MYGYAEKCSDVRSIPVNFNESVIFIFFKKVMRIRAFRFKGRYVLSSGRT